MLSNSRTVTRGSLKIAIAVAFLLGMWVDAFARVMWVEDLIGPDDETLVYVNGWPPSLIVTSSVALALLALGIVEVVRSRGDSVGAG